ncbi:MAG: UPF0102 protein [Pseudohongiella sp.]|nr:MAG: UPF0102 protein [Pseudohongiella sp.]
MSINSLAFGHAQESKAARYLRAQGLKLLSRNYRSRYGEIDLIMRDSHVLVFVEVRYRRGELFGDAIDSVTASKQNKLRLAATHYLQSHPRLQHCACRFDVIGLSQPDGSTAAKLEVRFEWIKNAFY